MAINKYNLKKWAKMLMGRSILHVNQGVGRCFRPNSISGYYNDLTEKVLKEPKLLGTSDLPKLEIENGDFVEFPVAIFQYGLGAYDLYLLTQEEKFLLKFKQCVDWCIDHQNKDGSWNNFFFNYPEHPYGAMAQGEGCSLLARAYTLFEEKEYREKAKCAIDFMLRPLAAGGTTLFKEEDIILMEFTHLPAVLNGWIFAWFGLYDASILFNEDSTYQKFKEASLRSIIKYLPRFSNSYWSFYDLKGNYASPFYHRLHIAQLKVLSILTQESIFEEYEKLWECYQKNFLNRCLAFAVKSAQKIVE